MSQGQPALAAIEAGNVDLIPSITPDAISTSLSADRPALIVGAGIGGLAAAVGLQRAGWRVRVLERDRRETFVPGWYRVAAVAQALAPSLVARALARRRQGPKIAE